MKNIDKRDDEFVHLYIALRRKKENPDLPALYFRQIIFNDEVDLKALKVRIDAEEGVWRIHKTVNKRDCKKAAKLLLHKLIDDPELATRIPSLWKTCLMQPKAKGDRMFLIDLDNKNILQARRVTKTLETIGIDFDSIGIKQTPNGFHMILPAFDSRVLSDFKDVTILKDGYVFLETYEVE